jgi:hypothetical protein
MAGIINAEALRLTRLLDDLLDLSVLENGQVTLHMQHGLLSDLLDRAVDAAGHAPGALRIDRSGASHPLWLETDLDRLCQVFINLIANAAKYCSAPVPELRVLCHHINGRQVVDFIDNGRGIAAPDREVIFEKFSRLGDSSRAGGAGLGLAISKEIMTRLGGDVAYVPDQAGTCFRVTLPAIAPSAAKEVAVSATP